MKKPILLAVIIIGSAIIMLSSGIAIMKNMVFGLNMTVIKILAMVVIAAIIFLCSNPEQKGGGMSP